MAITKDNFNKIWASTSPLTPYEFSESNYKEGWNFIGGTPPSRQMWDFLQKNNDEKMQYLLNNFDNYLPLSGGTVTGDLDVTGAITGASPAFTGNPTAPTQAKTDNSTKLATTAYVKAVVADYLALTGGSITGDVDITGDLSVSGAITGTAENGSFGLVATDGTNSADLVGYPSGALTWAGKHLECAPDLSVFKTAEQFTKPSIVSSRVKDVGGGYKKVGSIVYVYVRFRMNTTLTKGGWSVLDDFPAPYNMGFSADYRIPLIATAWYGDSYSGNVSSAFIEPGGTLKLITNSTMDAISTSNNYYIYIYGTYYS